VPWKRGPLRHHNPGVAASQFLAERQR